MELTKTKYKQTEVGLIPEDWRVVRLVDALTKGQLPSGLYKDKALYGSGTKIIKLGDVFAYDYYMPQFAQRVQILADELTSYIIKEGDLIVALASVKLEGVGKVLLVDKLDEPTVYDHNVALIRLDKNFDYQYFGYIFKSYKIRLQVSSNATQVGTTFLKASSLKKFNIPIPSTLTEQKAIATALSDVDDLIANLDKLITKKKAIKQGAMQQLLTPPNKGGKRLAGFTGEWVEKKLGDVLDVVTDYTANGSFASLKENVTYYSEFNYAVLVRTTDLDKKKFEPERFTDKQGYDFLKKTNLYGGEIIMANVGSIGKVFRVPKYNIPMTLAPNTYLLKFHSFVDNEFMYIWMKTKDFVNKLMSKVGSTTLLAINKDNLRDINVWLPQDIEEQKSIATIILDVNKDLEQLESKRAKYLNIKQGMMQELLTGKTRLI